jgi:putative phosphoesterase
MKVGIVADSHDDMESISRVVEIFNSRGVSLVIHAGDVVSPFTVEIFGGLKCPLAGVYGNNDGDRLLLRERYDGVFHPQPHFLSLDGRSAVVVHEHHLVESLAASARFDLVVYGHTHTPDVRTVGGTLIVNPGKAARLHKGRATAAVLDTATMEAQVIDLYDLSSCPP